MSWFMRNRKKLFFGSGMLFIIIVLILIRLEKARQLSVTNEPRLESTILQAYISDGSLFLVDVLSGEAEYRVVLPADMVPQRISAGKIRSSDDRSLYAWFVPQTGIVVHHVESQATRVVADPSVWFLENPYFSFVADSHTLWYIDNQGQEMVQVDVDTGDVVSQTIPFPYGSYFVLSPDAKRVLLVEGYGQTQVKPSYLVATTAFLPVERFSTGAEVSQRDWVAWSADSNLVLGVVDNSLQTVFTFSGAGNGYRWVEIGSNDQIMDLFRSGSLVLLQSSSTFYLFDTETLKILRQVPVDLFSRLKHYSFLSFDNQRVVIEEEIRGKESISYRLWTSDWFGNLDMVVPVYERRLIDTIAPESIGDGLGAALETVDR